jgi:hypothetical protein
MKQPFWAPALARVWRLLALACAAWLLHSAPHRTAPPLSLEDARAFFPTAARLLPRADGAVAAQDEAGQSLGLLVVTSPEADSIVGYAGPSNLLVGLDTHLTNTRLESFPNTPNLCPIFIFFNHETNC